MLGLLSEAADEFVTTKTEARAFLTEFIGVIGLLSFSPPLLLVLLFFFDPKRPRGQMLPYAPFFFRKTFGV